MKIQVDIPDQDYNVMKALCERKGLDTDDFLKGLLLEAIESYLEDVQGK